MITNNNKNLKVRLSINEVRLSLLNNTRTEGEQEGEQQKQ